MDLQSALQQARQGFQRLAGGVGNVVQQGENYIGSNVQAFAKGFTAAPDAPSPYQIGDTSDQGLSYGLGNFAGSPMGMGAMAPIGQEAGRGFNLIKAGIGAGIGAGMTMGANYLAGNQQDPLSTTINAGVMGLAGGFTPGKLPDLRGKLQDLTLNEFGNKLPNISASLSNNPTITSIKQGLAISPNDESLLANAIGTIRKSPEDAAAHNTLSAFTSKYMPAFSTQTGQAQGLIWDNVLDLKDGNQPTNMHPFVKQAVNTVGNDLMQKGGINFGASIGGDKQAIIDKAKTQGLSALSPREIQQLDFGTLQQFHTGIPQETEIANTHAAVNKPSVQNSILQDLSGLPARINFSDEKGGIDFGANVGGNKKIAGNKEPLPWENQMDQVSQKTPEELVAMNRGTGENAGKLDANLAESNQQFKGLAAQKPPGSTNPPLTVPDRSISLSQAAKNALSEKFYAQQSIREMGTNTAGIIDKTIKGDKDTEYFRQVIEHPERMDETLTQVKNPKAFTTAVKEFRGFTDKVFKLYDKTADPQNKIGFIKEYYSHILDLSDPKEKERYDEFMNQVVNTKGWWAKNRIFKDIDELRAAGFELKNKTIAQDLLDYTRSISKSAGANAFIAEVRKTHPEELAVLKDVGKIPMDNQGRSFLQVNHPGMQATFLSQDLMKKVNTLNPSAFADNPVVKTVDVANRFMKTISLAMGGFHALKTTSREVAAQGIKSVPAVFDGFRNAISDKARLKFRNDMINQGVTDYASKIGVTLGTNGDVLRENQNVFEKLQTHNPVEAFNRGLFGGLIDTYKLNLTKAVMSKFDLEDPMQLQEARRYGAQINNLMGGLNYEVLNRNKTMQQLLRFGVLAPDFNEGKIRQLASALKITDWSPSVNFARRTLVGEALVMGVLAELGRRLVTGQFDNNFKDLISNAFLSPSTPLPSQFNNPKNNKPQAAALPGSTIADAYRAVSDPEHFLEARGSAGIGAVTKLASGKDYYGTQLVDPYSGQPDNLLNRAKAIGPNMLPIPVVQGMKVSQGKETLLTAIANTAGMRVHTDMSTPQAQQTQQYFTDIQNTKQSLNPNDQAVFDTIHPQTKDSNGNPVVDKNVYTTPDKYETLLANPKVLAAEQAFQKARPNHDPLWDLNATQLRAYMQAEVISKNNPIGGFGSNNPQSQTTKALFAQLPQGFFQQRQQWASSLPASTTQGNTQQAPQMPQGVSQFWQQYANLPYGTGARSKALASPMGQQALAFINQQQVYTNQQRADMGLPMLTPSQTGTSSTGGKSSSGGSGGMSASTFRRAMKNSSKQFAHFKSRKPKASGHRPVAKLKQVAYKVPLQKHAHVRLPHYQYA